MPRNEEDENNDANATANSVREELKEIREKFPQVKIQTATKDFLSASYERTPYTRIKFTLTFPNDYPDHPLIVDVASDKVVPPGLKKKLDTELVNNLVSGSYGQVWTVMQNLVNFVDHNKFLPCWRELKQCTNLVRHEAKCEKTARSSNSSSSISIFESKAKIKLQLVGGKYFYRCSIAINDGYPSTTTHEDWGKACDIKMESTNFPPKIETMLTSQARDLVRKMQDGMNADDALKVSNPMRLPKNVNGFGDKKEVQVRLTQDALKSLKKDTDTLSRVRDLREIDAATVQGNARIKAHHAKERKDARRTIHKITDLEIARDKAQEESDKQWQSEEQARMAGYNIPDYDGSNPQPSLLSLVNFLMEKIQRLPDEHCPCCKTYTLPSDPTELKLLYLRSSDCKTDKEKKSRRVARGKRPIRTYCGCWYHYDCLNKFMTEPPFGATCPTADCGRRVYHPDWPDDIKQLERAWANQQARKREIEDAQMFL